jgi:nucleoside-diphosphate-sugar epimerase
MKFDRTHPAWNGLPVLVTGGASFIGSHLVDALVARGARVSVADDLSSGSLANVREHADAGRIAFFEGDLHSQAFARDVVAGQRLVFHLAADHGGRGYLERNQAACARNLVLDGIVFEAAHRAGVEKVVFASSGCVYPNRLQTRPEEIVYLTEEMVGPPYDADTLYGWAKLMAELTLRAYHRDHGMKAVSCRYFTVYGPRGLENHALMAMIARAFVGRRPFEVWGTGEQIRSWSYVTDIVEGTIRAAERIDDGTAINLGTMERVRVLDAAREVLSCMDVEAEIVTRPDMPTGPYNRVAHNGLARKLLDWEPKVEFAGGLRRTIDWYVRHRDRGKVAADLERLLVER